MKLITSWDDGNPLDFKLAELLNKYSIEAVFYIPINNTAGSPVLNRDEIRDLGQNFTIGAHTYNHIKLTQVSAEEVYKEIYDGKVALEDIIQKKIDKFSYPCGYYNKSVVNIAKSIGFSETRSARLINFNCSRKEDFVKHPNIHFFAHRMIIDMLHCLKQKDYMSLYKRLLSLKRKHIDLFRFPDLFENEIVHIWGHSWEIEKYNLWGKLEEVFKYYDSVDFCSGE